MKWLVVAAFSGLGFWLFGWWGLLIGALVAWLAWKWFGPADTAPPQPAAGEGAQGGK